MGLVDEGEEERKTSKEDIVVVWHIYDGELD